MRSEHGGRSSASLAIGLLLLMAGCGTAPNLPPYGVQFDFGTWGRRSSDPKAYAENEAITAHGYVWKFDKKAQPPDMPPTRGNTGRRRHWLTLILKDPDDLVYRWQRELSEKAYGEELKQWQTAARGRSFTFDLRDWVPDGFRWKAGKYLVRGVCSVSGRAFEASGGLLFMKHVPEEFRRPVPPQPHIGPAKPLLKAELAVNKEQFKRGELIVFEGFVQNVSDQAFMLQAGVPFLEARLVALPGGDSFPESKPQPALRLSYFVRLEPGQRLLVFRQAFVAGRCDRDWLMGARRGLFPTPFPPSTEHKIWFELFSDGIFPEDQQPDIGIWTGHVESNRVSVHVE